MKSFVLISRDRPPKSSKMKVRPLEIVRVTLQMGPDDTVWLSLCLRRDTHTCFRRFLPYALATSGSFSPRNLVRLILKILFDVDKSDHIGLANAPSLTCVWRMSTLSCPLSLKFVYLCLHSSEYLHSVNH